jgi:DNA-binding SARP family transcriptional activator
MPTTTAPTTTHPSLPPVATSRPAPSSSPDTTSTPTPILLISSGIAAAGLVALLNRMRRSHQRRRAPGSRPHTPPPTLRQAENTLRRAADLDAAEFLDLALRAFAAGSSARTAPMPSVLACRVGLEQVEVFLAAKPERIPEGFVRADHDRGWTTDPHLDEADLRELAAGTAAPLPSLVSLGLLEDGELLVDLETAGVITVDGDAALVTAMLRAVAIQLATGTWIDHVEVMIVGRLPIPDEVRTPRIRHHAELGSALDELEVIARDFDADLATARCNDTLNARLTRVPNDGWIPTILVCDKPIDAAALERLVDMVGPGGHGVGAIVRSAHPTRWHANVRTDQIVLAPFGFRIHPNLINTDTADALDDFFTDAANAPTEESLHTAAAAAVERTTPTPPFNDDPFELEVRLLGPIDISGLAEPMSRPKSTELTAFLALHPNGVTDDRLKAMIWPDGSPAPNAFNTIVSLTRGKLGRASDGSHHFPHYQAAGQLYRLGDRVTTDIARFQARVAHAQRCTPSDAIATLRSALELVRGQPFQAARGYEWAFSEGLVGHCEAMVADAAHQLAELYLELNDPISASWAATQGLQASPGNEALYRDRMLAYDLAGNPAGVERVMQELCDVVEAVEPYDTLHPDTLALYEQLTHRARRPTESRQQP